MPKMTAPHWEQVIRHIVENEPDLSAAAIANRLSLPDVREQAPEEAGNPPVERTVLRIRRRHEQAPEQERQQYRYVAWPESFLAGLLPRRSARAILDEIARWHSNNGQRISVRRARWYWLLCEAMGEDVPPRDQRVRSALHFTAASLSGMEVLGGPSKEDLRAVELWLAYRAWGTDEDGLTAGEVAYTKAVAKQPDLEWNPGYLIPEGTPADVAYAASVEFFGEQAAAFIEKNRLASRTTSRDEPGGSANDAP